MNDPEVRWNNYTNELEVPGMKRVLDILTLLTTLEQDPTAAMWVKPPRAPGYWPCRECARSLKWSFQTDRTGAGVFVGHPHLMPNKRHCICGVATYKVTRSR